jgi:hypothetical protein
MIDSARRTAKPDPLRFCAGEPGQDSLSDPFPLELSQRRKNVQLKLARRSGRVDTLSH